MSQARPSAALSLDLDDMWSYLKTRGDEAWKTYPSYLDRFLPMALDLLGRRGLKATFFIVGRDAAELRNLESLASIARAGHEVGNHSFNHEPKLQALSAADIAREVAEAEKAIAAATGVRPRGFRGPGFTWSPELFRVLADRGYLYDASTLPTFLGPLGRMYYFATAPLDRGQKEERKELFGRFGEGFRAIRPYHWRLKEGNGRLLEVPVTTMPGLRTPFHLSYLLYLGRRSRALMRTYFRMALGLCRAAGTGLSFLLHPLDLLCGDDVPALRFFPAMDMDRPAKLRLAGEVLDLLVESFEVLPLGAYAERWRARPDLRSRPLPPPRSARGQRGES